MDRSEGDDARRAVIDEFLSEFCVDFAGVFGIAEAGFGFECIGIEPIE